MFNYNTKDNALAIVLELGEFSVKAGYGGADKPFTVIDSDVIYIKKEENKLEVYPYSPLFFSNNNNSIRQYEISNYFKHCQNNNTQYMIPYFEHLFKKINVNPEDKYFFIIEPPMIDNNFKINITNLFFNYFKISKISFIDNATLASFCHSKESSLVIDIGGYNTYITPLHEGEILENGFVKSNYGSENLTLKLEDFLNNTGKQNIFDYKFFENKNTPSDILTFSKRKMVRELKENCLKLTTYGINNFNFNPVIDNYIYVSAQKENVMIGKELFEISENLFTGSNEFEGIGPLIFSAIEKIDPEIRKEVVSNIIITGGGTNIPNFLERLQRELYDCYGDNTLISRIKFFFCNGKCERRTTSWLGGSIMSITADCKDIIMTREEYLEHGVYLIEKKSI